MCLVAFALHASPRFPFVLASNRDEFHARPSAALAWWRPDGAVAPVLAGRDLDAGGSWLGLNAAGRLAVVTNLRDGEPGDRRGLPSRGELVPRWLAHEGDAQDYWVSQLAAGQRDVNLLVFHFPRGTARVGSSQTGRLAPIAAGVHGLSNGAFDSPWPKVTRLRSRLRAALACADTCDAMPSATDALVVDLLVALADRERAADADLPSTGIPRSLERRLSAAFIGSEDGRYGTRCSTVIVMARGALGLETRVVERRYDAAGQVSGETDISLPGWPAAMPAAA